MGLSLWSGCFFLTVGLAFAQLVGAQSEFSAATSERAGVRIDVHDVSLAPLIGGTRNELLVTVDLEVANTDDRVTLETRVADLLVLLDTMGYTHDLQPDTFRDTPRFGDVLILRPGKSITGQAVFHISAASKPAQIAFITEAGPLLVDLISGGAPMPRSGPIASSDMQGPIRFEVYGVRQLGYSSGFVLDVGLHLISRDLMVLPPVDVGSKFELHDFRGRFYQAGGNVNDLEWPLQSVILRRGIVTRGELLFADAPSSGQYTLILPYAGTQIRADLPLARADMRAPSPYRSPRFEGQGQAQASSMQSPLPSRPAALEETVIQEKAVTEEIELADYPQTLQGIPTVMNTGLLDMGGRLIALEGVRGASQPFADQLSDFLGDRQISCNRVQEKVYRCALEGRDISKAVVLNGAGWATQSAASELQQAQETARREGRGVWQ